MKRTEKILVILAVLGMMGQTANVAMLTPVVILSITGLALFYLVGTYFLLKTEESEKRSTELTLGIATGVGLSFTLFGLLFSFQLWPGAFTTTMGGLFILVVCVVLVLRKLASNPIFTKNYLQRALPVAAVALALNMGGSMLLVEMKYADHPQLVEAIKAFKADPNKATDVALQVEHMRKRMNQEQFLEALSREAARDSFYTPYYEKEKALEPQQEKVE